MAWNTKGQSLDPQAERSQRMIGIINDNQFVLSKASPTTTTTTLAPLSFNADVWLRLILSKAMELMQWETAAQARKVGSQNRLLKWWYLMPGLFHLSLLANNRECLCASHTPEVLSGSRKKSTAPGLI